MWRRERLRAAEALLQGEASARYEAPTAEREAALLNNDVLKVATTRQLETADAMHGL